MTRATSGQQHGAELAADSLGASLRELRKQRGMTLRDVEGRTTISNSYLSQLENGYVEQPSPRNLQLLAEAYSVSYESLMNKAGYLMPAQSAVEGPRQAAFNLVADLDAEEIEEVQEFVNFLRFKRQAR